MDFQQIRCFTSIGWAKGRAEVAPSFYATALVVIGICQLLPEDWHRALLLISFGFLSPAFATEREKAALPDEENSPANSVPEDN